MLKSVGRNLFVSDKQTSYLAHQGVKQGHLREIVKSLYTSDLKSDVSKICANNASAILAHFFPGAIVADRSALRGGALEEGCLFVVHDRVRPLVLPGLTIISRQASVSEQDRPFLTNGLKMSSLPRALLDNLKLSRRSKNAPPRTVGQEGVEAYLERLLSQNGGDKKVLESIRSDALLVSEELGMADEFRVLTGIIGALRGTAPVEATTQRVSSVKARIAGVPYDEERVRLFEGFVNHLNDHQPVQVVSDIVKNEEAWKHQSFFDAYFSNFIEGTEFEVEEAKQVVFDNAIPDFRRADAHDIRGTFMISSNPLGMSSFPESFERYVERLKQRHASIMGSRPDKLPGQFKTHRNRVGGHFFVSPELVEGTLKKGFGMLDGIYSGFGRALFLHAVLAEIHPFEDGNGRMARIEMNNVLTASGLSRIMIPTVYRNNYISGLEALTSNRGYQQFVEVMHYAQRWTKRIPWGEEKVTIRVMEDANAFRRPSDDVRLRMPSDLDIERALDEVRNEGEPKP